MIALVLALAADPPFEMAAPLAPPSIRLHAPADPCDRSSSAEIVVCGRAGQGQRYRLPKVEEERYAESPVRAQAGIGNGTLSAHTEDKQIGGGLHSKRAMVTFRLPLGGK